MLMSHVVIPDLTRFAESRRVGDPEHDLDWIPAFAGMTMLYKELIYEIK